MSHKEILRSSSIVAGAAVVNVAVGLVKTKIVALLLGPAGLGIIILLQTVMQTVASVASLGLGQAGTRQIAEANSRGDGTEVAAARRALLIATTVLGLASAAAIWLASDALARSFALGPRLAWQVRWLAIGTALTVSTQAQVALLMGFRRLGDMARVSTYSVFASAIIGVAAVWWWGQGGIVAFVLSQVVATILISHFYVRRLGLSARTPIARGAVQRQLGALLIFGGAVTVAAVCVNVGQLLTRVLIQQRLGATAVGQFQASWLISITYIAFILQAMGADFYPRIVAASREPARLVRLVNDQIEVALLLAAPVLLGMLGGAPWVMRLLYSRAFDPAVAVLQWQILGDVLKVASFPLGYLLLAIGASRIYMAAEVATVAVLLAALWFLLPILGLEASGVAVLGMYMFYLPFACYFAARRVDFRPTRANLTLSGLLFGSSLLILMVTRLLPVVGVALSFALAVGAAALCLWRLRDALPGPLSGFARRIASRWQASV